MPEESLWQLSAAVVIQRRWRERRKKRLLEEHEFTKWLDAESGEYYYVHRHDPTYTTWSRPVDDVPLQPPVDRGLRRARIAAEQHAKFERRKLVALVQARHAEAARVRRHDENERQEKAIELAWAEAFSQAKTTGQVTLSHKRLGNRLHSALFAFPETFGGTKLVALRLVAHDLTDLSARVGTIASLTALSLASNNLVKLPDAICDLVNLTSLNVLRNKLTELPAKVGDLVNLVEIHAATNRLRTVPPGLGKLTRLDRLVLDCNRLRRLPETLGQLKCTTVSVNSNELVALPHCLFSLERLSSLSANDNKLRQLPNGIGASRSLTRLMVAGNSVAEMPESLGQLTQLKELWLDHNRELGALPWNFFALTELQVLHLEGTVSLAYPTPEIGAQGPEAVREWSRRRQKHALFVRKHRIAMAVVDIFEQIVDAKPSVCSAAYFEPNVQHADDLWFAVVMDHFWDSALPALRDRWDEGRVLKGRVTCLPYDRNEVDKVLRTYRDAEGPILVEDVTTMFRRCACVDEQGRRKVCIPPAPGWMCKRKATLIKMHVVLERERLERERKRRERLAIDHALDEARDAAHRFALSDEGQTQFFGEAHKQARAEMEVRRSRRAESELAAKVESAALSLRTKFDKRRAQLKDQRAKHEVELYRKLREDLEPREAELEDGYARDRVSAEIDATIAMLADLPEDAALRNLDSEQAAALAASEAKVKSQPRRRFAMFSNDAKEERDLVDELQVDLVNRYTTKLVHAAEKKCREDHAKMRTIAHNWQGLAVYDVFQRWRKYARKEHRRRAKDAWASRADELQAAADKAATLTFATWNLERYERYHDDWSDLPYWRHADTRAVVWDEPTLANLLPPGFVAPDDDVQTTLQAQARSLVGRDDNSTTTKASSEVASSETSEEDSDDTTTAEQDEEEEEETPQEEHGLLTRLVDEDDDLNSSDDDDQNNTAADDSDDDDEGLLEWQAEDAYLPAVRDVVDESSPQHNRDLEVEAALERAQLRRKVLARKKQASTTATTNQTTTQREADEEPQEEEEALQSFDPTKKYTQVELTMMAREAHKRNKGRGIAEDMRGAFEPTAAERGGKAVVRGLRWAVVTAAKIGGVGKKRNV